MTEPAQTASVSPHPMLLEQLRDLHLPDAAPWWAMAPGWWCLVALGLTLVIFIFVKAVRLWRSAPAETALVSNLNRAYHDWHHHNTSAQYLQDVALTLRAHAIDRKGCQAVARLSGADWIQWLEKQRQTTVSDTVAKALSQQCYQRDPNTDITTVHHELQRWAQSDVNENRVHKRA